MAISSIQQYDYLIIGGTTKAATTSLYYYLADHPEVCATTLKETRFFLDPSYPVQPQSAKWQDGIEQYKTFFKTDAKCLRVEATPDYLYSSGTPQRLKTMLPNAKVVFILRDPITRLVSWYKYAKQRNNIPASMTFDEYVELQLRENYFEKAKQTMLSQRSSEDANLEYFLSALEHGCYSSFLKDYIDTLGKENVKIYFYEDLCTKPLHILEDICGFASIKSDFYQNYDFKVFNRSVKIGNTKLNDFYSKLRRGIRRRTHNLPIHNSLRQVRLWFDPIYNRLNSQEADTVEITPSTRRKLESYYRDDIRELQALVGHPTPWGIDCKVEEEVFS